MVHEVLRVRRATEDRSLPSSANAAVRREARGAGRAVGPPPRNWPAATATPRLSPSKASRVALARPAHRVRRDRSACPASTEHRAPRGPGARRARLACPGRWACPVHPAPRDCTDWTAGLASRGRRETASRPTCSPMPAPPPRSSPSKLPSPSRVHRDHPDHQVKEYCVN